MKETNLKTLDECIAQLEQQANGVLSLVKGNKIYHLVQNDTYNELASSTRDATHIKKLIGEKEYLNLCRKYGDLVKRETQVRVIIQENSNRKD